MATSNTKKRDENWKERRMVAGILWKWAMEFKLLLTTLLFISAVATLLQFLHSSEDQVSDAGVLKRSFNPYGSAAYNFILMSAYRGGPNNFAVVGLSSKPLHVYGNPSYQCQWQPRHRSPPNSITTTLSTAGEKILPDGGYGRVYTVVVVNCTFPTPASEDGNGGKLVLHASTNGGADTGANTTDTILALDETPEAYASYAAQSTSPPAYDYLYCGSPLYGNLSPQRVREWVAYHVRLLGAKSHFVIHDAGGVHQEMREVLKPWMERGFVSVQDVREQERFDGYYHNQFLILNDCLHRHRFMAKWIFFFDVDEFVFVPKNSSIKSFTDSLSDFTQFVIRQMAMSSNLCFSEEGPLSVPYRKWGMEKLVYRFAERKGKRRDIKYAVQPRNVMAAGVHISNDTVGKTTHKTVGRIMYFHYHGTIANRREPCNRFFNQSQVTVDGTPYVLDTTMREVAGAVKRFELNTIGDVLRKTRQ